MVFGARVHVQTLKLVWAAADEPTSGLDSTASRLVMAAMHRVRAHSLQIDILSFALTWMM